MNFSSYSAKSKRTIRLLVWKKTNGYCYLCGINLLPFGNEDNSFQIDHKTPIIKGGSDTVQNMYPSCSYCNHMKGTRTYEDFLNFIHREIRHNFFIDERERSKKLMIYAHIGGLA